MGNATASQVQQREDRLREERLGDVHLAGFSVEPQLFDFSILTTHIYIYVLPPQPP